MSHGLHPFLWFSQAVWLGICDRLPNLTQKWDYFESRWQDTERQTQAQEDRKILQEIWLRFL